MLWVILATGLLGTVGLILTLVFAFGRLVAKIARPPSMDLFLEKCGRKYINILTLLSVFFGTGLTSFFICHQNWLLWFGIGDGILIVPVLCFAVFKATKQKYPFGEFLNQFKKTGPNPDQ